MPDYQPLVLHLKRRCEARVTLSFEQIQAIIDGPLPSHARVMTDWWSAGNVGHRHHTAPWQAVGWHLERLDTYHCTVTFVRTSVTFVRTNTAPPKSE